MSVGQWRRATTVWTVRLSGSGWTVLLRLSVESETVVGQGQATTIFHITLEVANSKAKSEGIQIYCYMKLWAMWE